MNPIFFNTKLHKVNDIATIMVFLRSKLLMASVLKNLLKSMVRRGIRTANPIEEDPDVTFEYLVGSCFPTIFQNVQSALNEEHTLGYMEGYKDGQKLTSKEKSDILN